MKSKSDRGDGLLDREVHVSPGILGILFLIAAFFCGLILQPGMGRIVGFFAAVSVLCAIVDISRESKSKRGGIRPGAVVDLVVILLSIGIVVATIF